MAASHLHTELWLPLAPAALFPFFADPANLQQLTPPWLDFAIVGCSTQDLGEGTEIDYRLRLHGVALRWRSRITEWAPPHGFCDVQVRGPYRHWRHRHHFAAEQGGTRTIDDVDYAVRLGCVLEPLFVRGNLRRIFGYRQQRMRELFGGTAPAATAATDGAVQFDRR